MGDEQIAIKNESMRSRSGTWRVARHGYWTTKLLNTQSTPTLCQNLEPGLGDNYTLRACSWTCPKFQASVIWESCR